MDDATIRALTVSEETVLRLPCEIFVPLTWEMGIDFAFERVEPIRKRRRLRRIGVRI